MTLEEFQIQLLKAIREKNSYQEKFRNEERVVVVADRGDKVEYIYDVLELGFDENHNQIYFLIGDPDIREFEATLRSARQDEQSVEFRIARTNTGANTDSEHE